MEWKSLIILVLVLFFISFALQNPGETVVKFLTWHSPSVPLVYLLVFSLGLGIIIARLLGMIKRIKLHNEIRRLKKKIKSQDDELKRLRTLSLISTPQNNEILDPTEAPTENVSD